MAGGRALREAGANVEKVAAYRRIVPEPSMRDWERVHALLAGEPHAWLLTSSEGVRNLEELAREHLTVDETLTLKHAPLVTPHPVLPKPRGKRVLIGLRCPARAMSVSCRRLAASLRNDKNPNK